ncbi:MAG: hypothetical protein IT282_01445, partial [Bacteroidetes bacterium]|nr:hypothetical protein [Bacteroidota bacterium]
MLRALFILLLVILGVCALLLPGCRESVSDNPVPGKPPQTFLWLFPEGELRTGVSRTHLRWWGESPDGLIRGYLFSFKIV